MTPTRFYKEREHTAEALEIYRARSSLFFFPIFVSPTKIKSFFVKDLIEQTNKVYKVRKQQTLTCIDCFNVWIPLGFGTSSCSCIGSINIRYLWLHDGSWVMWMMIRGCLLSNHHYRACFLLRKFLKPMIVSYADPAHYSYICCDNYKERRLRAMLCYLCAWLSHLIH